MKTNNPPDSQLCHDRWKPYHNLMACGPIVAGFVLPYIIYSLFDSEYITYLMKETDELAISVAGSFICSIPFFVVAHFTRRDRESNISFKNGLTNLAVRFLPVFMLYAFFLFDVARSAALRLPGASTAGIGILLFQPVAVLFVFVVNWILKEKNKTNNET